MRKAVLVHAFKEQVLGILLILHEMLFVGHDEVAHAARDWMIFIYHLYFKRTERWMLFRHRSEHIPEIFVVRAYISHVVVKKHTAASAYEAPDRPALLRGDPI